MELKLQSLEDYSAVLRARHTSARRRFLACGFLFLVVLFANWIFNPGNWPAHIFFVLAFPIGLAIQALWLEGMLEFVDVLRRATKG